MLLTSSRQAVTQSSLFEAQSKRQRLLVIKLGALGDIFLATGALQDIRNYHPRAYICVLTRRSHHELFTRCPWVDEVLCDDNAPRWQLGSLWKMAQMLRAERFDRVYDLQASRRSFFYVRSLLRANSGGPVQHALPDRSPRMRRSVPVLVRHKKWLEAEGVPTRHVTSPCLNWLCESPDDLLSQAGVRQPYAVLLPGSSARHAYKRWPHFKELAKVLHGQGVEVITIPGPEELRIRQHTFGITLTAGPRALNLFELAGVLKDATFVVGNDSGPTHLAALLGIPGLGLFGGKLLPASTSMTSRGFLAIHSVGFIGVDVDCVVNALTDARLLDRLEQASRCTPKS